MRLLKSSFGRVLISLAVVLAIIPGLAAGRAMYDEENALFGARKTSADIPYVQGAVHAIGKIGLAVTNQGNFGTGFIGAFADDFTGLAAPSCVYPYPGNNSYLFSGAFWIGAIVGRDTLVSVGADGWFQTREMWPDPYPVGAIVRRSIKTGDPAALSEQDLIAVYTDTVTNPQLVLQDNTDGRPHIPLGIEITQRSFAWSYSYAEDFILFDYSIKNIGRRKLNSVYMGIYVDGDVGPVGAAIADATDDICGFKRSIPSPIGCGFIDTVNIAWITDNDGRTDGGSQQPCPSGFSLTSITGSRVVRTPLGTISDSLKYSFNWWVSNGDPAQDFGPRRLGTPEDPFRDFGGFLGTPAGDRNKYYIMRHEEFDYDQLFTAQDHTSEGWLPPPNIAGTVADGFDTRYLLSFGPFDINPGEVLPITFAYVAGENFHTQCEAFRRLFNPAFPEDYYNYFNFEDLGKNALWAGWIYDNPGFDTDGDNRKGKYRICVYDDTTYIDTISLDPFVTDTIIDTLKSDTLYYEGDGVPDFRGAAPPPPPVLRVYPRVNKFYEGELQIRWNGLKTETEKDVFSNQVDFEGYRVKMSLSSIINDFVPVTSYDKEDFNKYIWNRDRALFELKDPPFNLDSLKILYGSDFDPISHNRDYPFYWRDSAFYFDRQDWNRSDLADTNLIHKLYPDEHPPTIPNVDSARVYYPEELTEDGYFKYYEYEYTLRHLLPSQLIYVTVLSFDYGSPGSGLASLESTPSANMVAEYPQNQTSVVESAGLKVIAYPNPYRADGKYRTQEGGGFEGRGQNDLADDRVRRIHFTNLPHKCKIRIYTIDGDLVREINHDYAKDSPRSMHDEWDLITRNTQSAVSGIYYYSVESEFGTQVGKLVLIL